MFKATISRVFFSAALLLLFPLASEATIAMISGSKDNTLYEDEIDGDISNGTGEHFFAGRNNGGDIRRGLIAFDVASAIPQGATVQAVTLTLNMSASFLAGPETVSLHKVSADWGEGTSKASPGEGAGTIATATDATWLHRFHPTIFWASAGGDFSATPSASITVGGDGFYSWGPTAQMAADVQDWLDNPGNSFGWLLKGNEATFPTAKRFDSIQNATPSNLPVLVVDFTSPGVDTPTPTNTSTPLPTSTPTVTSTNTATSTSTPTPTATNTNTPLPPPTSTPTPSNSATPSDTATPTNTATNTQTPSETSTPSDTPVPSDTPTPSETQTPSPTGTNTNTGTPTHSPTDTPLPTDTPTASNTPSATASFTPTSTGTDTPTATATDTNTETPTPSETGTPTANPTETPTPDPILVDLVAHWSLMEGTGTVIADVSGNNSPGMLVNGPIWTEGPTGAGLAFSGVDDFALLGTSTFEISSEFSVLFWVKPPRECRSFHQVIITRGRPAEPFHVALFGNYVWAILQTQTQGLRYLRSDTRLEPNQWRHIAVTYEPGSFNLYLDGMLDATVAVDGQPVVPAESETLLGALPGDPSSRFLDAVLDDVRIYNSALPMQIIDLIMNRGFPPDGGIGDFGLPPDENPNISAGDLLCLLETIRAERFDTPAEIMEFVRIWQQ